MIIIVCIMLILISCYLLPIIMRVQYRAEEEYKSFKIDTSDAKWAELLGHTSMKDKKHDLQFDSDHHPY